MTVFNLGPNNILYYAEMATTTNPYKKDKRTEIKRMAVCTICKHKKSCTVTENNERIIYYCDTCYACELARSVPPMKFRRPRRTRIYAKQSIR